MNFKGKLPLTKVTNPYEIYFPFDLIRPSQLDFMNSYYQAIEEGHDFIASAPTGLGKTAASLSPAITYALKNDKVVFFLTSRTTQHRIVLETVKKIQEKYGKKIMTVDLIGKKWMCNHAHAAIMPPQEFSNFCKSHKENKTCDFYENLKEEGSLSQNTIKAMTHIKQDGPLNADELINVCGMHEVCSYEITGLIGKDAQVVIGDYFHLFNYAIRQGALSRMKINISDIILIVDEGHNLPNRIKDLATASLNQVLLRRIEKIVEQKFFSDLGVCLRNLNETLNEFYVNQLVKFEVPEKEITKTQLVELVERSTKMKYSDFLDLLIKAEDEFEDPKQKTPIQQFISFLVDWEMENKGYVRILSSVKMPNGGKSFKISYSCLDPSPITKSLFSSVHSTLLMSATLEPTRMYKEILGFDEKTVLKEYGSAFDEKNRLNLIVPETTSRYTFRTEENFSKIGQHICELVKLIPGNIAIFFPSYSFRDKVAKYFTFSVEKTVLFENPGMSKMERTELIEKFISYKNTGALLLAVSSGSFAEGVDLPGDQLKGVIVVGLPLSTPDLITKRTINYYNEKYNQGWNYAYIYPAMAKTIQSAGRCIRTESDRGAIIFLEERYINANYYTCFPKSWEIKVSRDYQPLLLDFFDQ